ncbi:Gfo/Idh/MocA family protein [Shumkonia mesophila]|uniref:Gfo/Idh/MocA family protein n=1 Tax=Shumkonia mesophila TaxID=2838854 RepID=UPI002934E77E|nr:Gfo/Idh/MocA family oxidoreductase [Shumkonia mesophila]
MTEAAIRTPENILIAGLGSIGRRHLQTVRAVLPDARIVILRRPGQALPAGLGAKTALVHDVEAALAAGVDAAIIANPAPFHVATALPLARAGVPLLIEKPLADSPEGLAPLLDACANRHVPLQVGYCLRFDPSLRAMKDALEAGAIGRVLSLNAEVGQYLPDWRPGTDYRQGVSARAALGGGALLELSHEIDYARWLAGEVTAVAAAIGRLGDLEIDVEDSADLLLTFASGARATVHLDMLQRPATRICRIVGSAGTLAWDGIRHQASLHRPDTDGWETLPAPAAGRDDIFQSQFRHFLEAIRTGRPPLIDGNDAARTLSVIAAARRSAAEQRTVRP